MPARRSRAIGAILAAVALASAAAFSAQAAPERPSSTTPCHLPHQPGTFTVPLTSAGSSRPYLLFIPSSYDGRKPLPLVLNLHPSGGNGAGQMQTSQMAAVANRNGFAVAAPDGAVVQGLGHYWNVPGVPLIGGTPVPPGTPSDEAYLLDVIRKTGKTLCVNSDRVYATGYSGGARMASQMACDHSTKIAAIAPVAGLRAGVPLQTSPGAWRPDPKTCQPKQPVAVRTFHGTADGTNPYLGNDDPRWGYSVDAALRRWAGIDHCTKGPVTSTITATVSLVLYSKCRSGTTVGLYREAGAGHTWPGDKSVPVGVDQSINASALIWRFFKTQTLADR